MPDEADGTPESLSMPIKLVAERPPYPYFSRFPYLKFGLEGPEGSKGHLFTWWPIHKGLEVRGCSDFRQYFHQNCVWPFLFWFPSCCRLEIKTNTVTARPVLRETFFCYPRKGKLWVENKESLLKTNLQGRQPWFSTALFFLHFCYFASVFFIIQNSCFVVKAYRLSARCHCSNLTLIHTLSHILYSKYWSDT